MKASHIGLIAGLTIGVVLVWLGVWQGVVVGAVAGCGYLIGKYLSNELPIIDDLLDRFLQSRRR